MWSDTGPPPIVSGQSLGEVTFKTQPDPREQPGEVGGGPGHSCTRYLNRGWGGCSQHSLGGTPPPLGTCAGSVAQGQGSVEQRAETEQGGQTPKVSQLSLRGSDVPEVPGAIGASSVAGGPPWGPPPWGGHVSLSPNLSRACCGSGSASRAAAACADLGTAGRV